ncbi:MAG: GFA family protein [Alphaproteobacteria bacterium]|nr:GFA family protein [Alphaproteobacteria bacterium]
MPASPAIAVTANMFRAGLPTIRWCSAGFAIVKGAPKIYKARPTSGGTFFCDACGVQIFSQPDSNPGLVAIKVGSLDESSDYRVQADIWMKSAPPWHRPHDGAKRVDGNLPG